MVEAPAKSGFGFFARLFRPKPAPPTPPVCQHDWTDLPEGYRLCKPCSRLERWDRGDDLQWGWQRASKSDALEMLERTKAQDFTPKDKP